LVAILTIHARAGVVSETFKTAGRPPPMIVRTMKEGGVSGDLDQVALLAEALDQEGEMET
jgi:hypothetical protein